MAAHKYVRARGGRIQVRFRVNGDLHEETVDLAPTERNLAAQSKRAQRLRDEMRLGLHGPRSTTPDFAHTAQQWLFDLDERGVQHSTRLSYLRLLEQHWLPPLGHRAMDSITAGEIRELVRGIHWPSAKTRNNALIPLRGVFAFAIEEYGLEIDPTSTLRNRKHQHPDIDAWSPEERDRILSGWSHRWADYWTFAFWTGLRPSEQIALSVEDVDEGFRSIAVVKGRVWGMDKASTKTMRTRTVLLEDEARDVLEHVMPDSGAIFRAQHDKPLQSAYHPGQALKARLEAVGVRQLSPYHSRHTRASTLLMGNATPSWVASQLGHSTETLIRRYGKWIPKNMERDEAEMRNARARLEQNSGQGVVTPIFIARKSRG